MLSLHSLAICNIVRFLRSFGLLVTLFTLIWLGTGCSVFLSSATSGLADNLSQAILDNNDLRTVQDGGPAYLLMIDGLLRGDPNNESLLRSAATLYSTYASVFVKDKTRAHKLSEKGLQYGARALCVRRSAACDIRKLRFKAFEEIIAMMNVTDVPALYSLGTAWAGWIQVRSDDFNAIAEISRVEAIMQRIVKLDETYQDAGAHLYLGVLATLIPPALGGKPEEGRRHFERAIKLSFGKNLMFKVFYARHYARLKYDRELHDRLLLEVLEVDPNIPGHTLINTLAHEQAKELLEGAEDFF